MIRVTAALTFAILLGTISHAKRAFDRSPQAQWKIDSNPALILGSDANDTSQTFTMIVGATLIQNRQVLVADPQSSYSLHLFDSSGKRLRAFGREGSGPGELRSVADLWHCGDSVYVHAIEGEATSVFTSSGTFVRRFRFGRGPQRRPAPPYRSVCNGAGLFAHYGWDSMGDLPKSGRVYRSRVPFWLTGADSIVRAIFDSFPGSERVTRLDTKTGLATGTGPRVFGRETVIAIGAKRVYIGTAERSEITAIQLDTRVVETIPVPVQSRRLTRADIEAHKAVLLAALPPNLQAGEERHLNGHPYPDSLPPYLALIVDSEDLLWVQDYPRGTSKTVSWRILSAGNKVLAQVSLPTFLTVFEVGRDYVLGRYLDPDESIPQVRVYRLTRK